MNDPREAAAAAPVDEAATRRALLHVLEDLQRERDAIAVAHQDWIGTVDAVREPLMVHDEAGRIVRANRAYAQRAGMEFAELLGKRYWECFPRLAAPLEIGADPDQEFKLENGEIFISHVHPVTGTSKRPAGWLHLFEDVTKKRLSEQRSQSHGRALDAIAASDALLEGDIARLAPQMTEEAARATGVERASLWLFHEGGSELRCVDLYEVTPAKHSAGMVLKDAEYRNEFDALRSVPYIAADNPLTDPRTAGYVPGYLKPLGISSMLDAAVRVSDQLFGVFCFEHVGKPHIWDPEEIAFASHIADKVAVAISNRGRRQAQNDLERRERFFRNLIEGSMDAFLVVDRAGTIVYRSESAASITGYGRDEVVGKGIADLVVPESLAVAQEALAERIRNPAILGRIELGLRRKDGSRADVEVSAKNLLADPDVNGIVVTLHDVSERKLAEQRIRTLNTLYATLSAINHAIVQSKTRKEISERIVRISTEVGMWHGAWVGFADPKTGRVVPEAWSESMEPYIGKMLVSVDPGVPEGQGPTGNAVRSGVPYFCNDIFSDPATRPWHAFARAFGINAVAAIPLEPAGHPAGVINLYAIEKEIYTPGVRALVVEMGDDVTFALEMMEVERQRRVAEEQVVENQDRLGRALEGTIEAIAATLESRDPYTAGHQRRVADLATAIAREMGLSEEAVQGIHFGALIHDLGKVQVPAEILSKPTRLTKVEFELIKTHPEVGYDIVKSIEFPWPVAQMVHQHHERLDGSGYPQGLKGDAIALEARILAVADVVEAMASHRPYRAGLGVDAALREIEAKRGVWFDPTAVDACLRMFREGRFKL